MSLSDRLSIHPRHQGNSTHVCVEILRSLKASTEIKDKADNPETVRSTVLLDTWIPTTYIHPFDVTTFHQLIGIKYGSRPM